MRMPCACHAHAMRTPCARHMCVEHAHDNCPPKTRLSSHVRERVGEGERERALSSAVLTLSGRGHGDSVPTTPSPAVAANAASRSRNASRLARVCGPFASSSLRFPLTPRRAFLYLPDVSSTLVFQPPFATLPCEVIKPIDRHDERGAGARHVPAPLATCLGT